MHQTEKLTRKKLEEQDAVWWVFDAETELLSAVSAESSTTHVLPAVWVCEM